MAMTGTAPLAGAAQSVPFAGDRRAETVAVVFVWAVFVLAAAVGAYPRAIDLMSTDDAMRLVQARDLLGGQGWFDLVQRRLNPPDGVLMHWTRLIDAPVAVLLAGFGALFQPETALKLTLTVWPALPLLPALFAAAAITRALGGAGAIGALMIVLSPGLTPRFTAGMIDHHGAQIALALVMLACVLKMDRSDKAAVGAGVAGALMLAIGMETLPIVAVLAALVAIRWAAAGPAMARGAATFGLAFAVSLASLALATIPPARWGDPVCDALGIAHLVAGGLGGLGLALATCARGEGALARFASLGLVGVVVTLGVAIVAPGCLGDPYAGLPEVLRAEWLSRIREARDIATYAADEPSAALVIVTLALAGLAAAVWALVDAGPSRRWSVWTAAVALAVACLIAAWQVRGSALAFAFGAPFLAAATAAIARTGVDRVRGLIAIAALNPTTIAHAGMAGALMIGPPPSAPSEARSDCPTSDYRALAALEPGLALNVTDSGPFILAFSPLSVVAAPYHRNVDGLTAQIEAFGGSEETARAVALSRRADYVVVCPADGGFRRAVKTAPDSFAAALAAGRPPAWAKPLDLGPGAKLLVYRVAPCGSGPELPSIRWRR